MSGMIVRSASYFRLIGDGLSGFLEGCQAAGSGCDPRYGGRDLSRRSNRSRDGTKSSRGCEFFRYPSTAEANEAAEPQITAHSPSDNSETTISDVPPFSGRAATRDDRSERDGPAVMPPLPRLRSAASGRW